MPFVIFCPSSHLILSAQRCPVCGWERPPAAQIGADAWAPNQLNAGLGGPGRQVFARPANSKGVVAFPLKNREVVGIDSLSGKERWRIQLGEGQTTRQIVTDGERFLLALSDERPIGQTGQAQLASIEAGSGKFTTLWQDSGHQLSAPALTEKLILLRTISGLVALSRAAQPELLWRLPLKTWWALPPFVADGKVFICDGIAMQNIGQLLAINLNDQRQVWAKTTNGMLNQPLTASGGALIFQNGHKQILALASASGDELWKLDFDKLYSSPLASCGQILCISRGAADRAARDHYLLNALDSASGKLLWQVALKGRVYIPPVCLHGKIYLASDDGRIFVIGAENHELLFEKQISSDEDPLHTELLVAEGILYAGTYNGLLTATRVEQPQEQLTESPAAYLTRGELDQAAAAYALQGDFTNAASLYASQIKEFKKALVLYERAGLYPEAAGLAASQGWLAEAENYYQLAGDPLNQAEMLLRRGDELGAARIFEQHGELHRAAKLFEHARDYLHALELYQRVKDTESEARAWEHLNRPLDTAQAYLRAGQQAEQEKPQNKTLVIELYQKAANYFSDCDQEEQEFNCRELIAKLQELPIVQIAGKTNNEFKEGGWNTLTLSIHNRGYGIAHQVTWRVATDRFEVEATTGTWMIKSLGIGNQKEVHIHIKPKLGIFGEAVPFPLEWDWQAQDGSKKSNRISASVHVRSKDDSRPTGQPVIIQEGGTYIQADKYVGGDDLGGGHKGDAVNIGRGSGLSASAGADHLILGNEMKVSSKSCPDCKRLNKPDAGFCIYCGFSLHA